jgi:hypothetical protein
MHGNGWFSAIVVTSDKVARLAENEFCGMPPDNSLHPTLDPAGLALPLQAASVKCLISQAQTLGGLFVGTYSTDSDTWMWAWGNDSLPAQVRAALGKVKRAGEETGFRRLTQGHWTADEQDGWNMTAYAYDVLGGLGAYRTPSDNGYVYMVIRAASRLQ